MNNTIKAKKTRDYKTVIDNDTLTKILENADEMGIYYETVEGTLQDNYLFFNDNIITFKGIRPRKYIIIEEKYLNEWSSELVMTMTDKDSKVDEFRMYEVAEVV